MRIQLLSTTLASLMIAGSSTVLAEDGSSKTKALVDAALLALSKDKKALRAFERVGSDLPGMVEARGVAALLLGKNALARQLLSDKPTMVVYYAMARADGAGGLSRAQSALAKAALGDDAEPGALFLAALAFARAGEAKRADALLAKAVKRTDSVLGEAFAPDPAVGMVRAVQSVLQKQGDEEGVVRLAEGLLRAGRRSEAIRIARAHRTNAKARRVLMKAWASGEPRRALEEAEHVLQKDPNDASVMIRRVELLLEIGDTAAARKRSRSIGPVGDADRTALARVRARLALAARAPREALEEAQAAARGDPKSDRNVALVAEALLLNKKNDRALEFARELLRRKPIYVDPFALLAKAQQARGADRKVKALRMRSEVYRIERKKLSRAVHRREEVIRAVRDADAGVGATGLQAIRGEEPMLALPVDLAIARHGKSGSARAARDRILSACASKFRSFLEHRGTWDQVEVKISPYGLVKTVDASLTAADPGRCSRPPQRSRKPKRSR